jgi:hypothetical protein
MFMRMSIAGLLAVCAAAAPKTFSGQAANEVVELTASPVLNRESLKQLIGSDLDGYYIVMHVTVVPKGDEPVAISRDDFLLRTDKDGERSRPFAPSQVAGAGVLIVSSGRGGAVMREDRGPVWGGTPGTGDRPRTLGSGSPTIGNTPSESSAQATIQTGEKGRKDPLLLTLEEKILPEKKTTEAVSGLLYFPLEIKQKAKDLELTYTTSAGKLSLRFREKRE